MKEEEVLSLLKRFVILHCYSTIVTISNLLIIIIVSPTSLWNIYLKLSNAVENFPNFNKTTCNSQVNNFWTQFVKKHGWKNALTNFVYFPEDTDFAKKKNLLVEGWCCWKITCSGRNTENFVCLCKFFIILQL